MGIIAQLLSPDFRWLWIEICNNALLSFVLALPLTLASRKKWPVIVAVFIGLFAIDIHGYFKVLASLGLDVQPLKGRTIVNSYGFELALLSGIYLIYVTRVWNDLENADSWKVKEKFSLLILSVACGFQANLFVDTLIQNQPLFYEPLTTILSHFGKFRFENIPKLFMGLYIALFLAEICLFSWEYWRQKQQLNIIA